MTVRRCEMPVVRGRKKGRCKNTFVHTGLHLLDPGLAHWCSFHVTYALTRGHPTADGSLQFADIREKGAEG